MSSPSDIALLANELREQVLAMITKAGNGHPGGSLSAIDIILQLYLHEMKHDPKNPTWDDRDRFVLSKGHGVPALYAVMAHCGYFPKEQLMTLRELGSPLQGHPANRLLPGIEASTGSLGQGLSVALGMALSARINQSKTPRFQVYAILGDGELQEGQVWEAAMCAPHYDVANLTVFIDRNNGQIDGLVDNIMTLEPLDKRFESFGWHVLTINGHDFAQIHNACEEARKQTKKPTMIIAKTIKGKGVSFLEKDTVGWHGKALTADELLSANKELGVSK